MTALTWRCTACRGRILDGAGYMAAPYEQISGDGPVTWRATHTTCTTGPDADAAYWIDVEQIRTGGQAADWTVHLAGKNWYHRSNWASVATQAAGGAPGGKLADALARAEREAAPGLGSTHLAVLLAAEGGGV
jgi:hypothetical protein